MEKSGVAKGISCVRWCAATNTTPTINSDIRMHSLTRIAGTIVFTIIFVTTGNSVLAQDSGADIFNRVHLLRVALDSTIDSRASLSKINITLDGLYADLYTEIIPQKLTPAGSTSEIEERLKILEGYHIASRLEDVDRTLGPLPAHYEVLYNLHLLTGPLKVNTEVVDAFNATINLTDLSEYAGFTNAFNFILDRRNDNVKNWLRNLLNRTKIGAYVTNFADASATSPAIGLAMGAINKFGALLKSFAVSKLKEKDLLEKYETIQCSLSAVQGVYAMVARTDQLRTEIKELTSSLATDELVVMARIRDAMEAADLPDNYAELSDEELLKYVASASDFTTEVRNFRKRYENESTTYTEFRKALAAVSASQADIERLVIRHESIVSTYELYFLETSNGFKQIVAQNVKQDGSTPCLSEKKRAEFDIVAEKFRNISTEFGKTYRFAEAAQTTRESYLTMVGKAK